MVSGVCLGQWAVLDSFLTPSPFSGGGLRCSYNNLTGRVAPGTRHTQGHWVPMLSGVYIAGVSAVLMAPGLAQPER